MDNNRGMALVTVFTIVFFLFALVGALLYLTSSARLLNERYNENLVALGLAEAGIDYAIWEINFDDADFAASEGWTDVSGVKKLSINDFQDAAGNSYGDINVEVHDYDTSKVTVVAQGTLDTLSGPAVINTVQVYLKRHRLYEYAILTADTIDIAGTFNKIDSYDSSLGPYGGTNIGSEGNIVTNSDATPAITLRGGANIDGDAITGPGGTVEFEGGAVLSGATDDTAEVFMPPVVVPEGLVNAVSPGPLILDGNMALELTAGQYKYDYLELTGKAILTLNAADGRVELYFTQNPSIVAEAQSQLITQNGPADIYFDGNVSISGQGISNLGGDPGDLTFYGTETVTNINLAGIGVFYGTFYAPEADYFYISGSSEIFGAVVGKNVVLTGDATIHYDEQLGVDGPSMGYDPYSWQKK